jgi:hypothetical protein
VSSSTPGSAAPLRLFYVVTVAGDFVFAAIDEAAAKAQSKYSVAFVREATDSDIAFVRSQRGTIPTITTP